MTKPNQSFTEEVKQEAEKYADSVCLDREHEDWALAHGSCLAGAQTALSILSRKSEGREFWIPFLMGDKENNLVLSGTTDVWPTKYDHQYLHVIEHSALVAERARRIAAEGERDMAHTTIGEKALEWAQTYTFNVQLQQEITTLLAKLAKARELYELATRELVTRDATDTDEHEGQEAAVDSWMADYDLELQKKGQGE